MPLQTVIENTSHISANSEIISHLTYLSKIAAPLILLSVSLVIYIWKKQDKLIEKFMEAFVKHVEENDLLHDKLFTQLRETDAKLNELIGEHKATHGGGK